MFPSMDAYGGWGAVTGHRVGQTPGPIKLSLLTQGYHRFPDTFYWDYASYLRDPKTGKDSGPLSPPIPNSRRIAFVGAGIGNLIAAYELARCGLQVIMFEARSRVGGRLRSESLAGTTTPCELGAMRIPDKSKVFWHYYAKYWVATHLEKDDQDPTIPPFPNPGVVPTHINWQNDMYQFCKASPWDQGSNLPAAITKFQAEWKDRWARFSVPYLTGPITIPDVRGILAQAVLSDVDVSKVDAFWKYCIAQYERQSFGGWLAEAWTDSKGNVVQWDTNELSAFATVGMGTGGFGPLFGVSFLEFLRLEIWDYTAEYSPPSDLTSFAEWMATQVGEQLKQHWGETIARAWLHLNSKVEGIVVKVDKAKNPVPWVVVDVKGQSWPFDYAVVGMPTRAMQSLGLDLNARPTVTSPHDPYAPFALPQAPMSGSTDFSAIVESVQAGIRRPNMMSASKTFTRILSEDYFEFWPRYEIPGGIHAPVQVTLTDKYPRGAYWLHPQKPADEYVGVLVSYTWGNDSTKMEAISNPAARNEILAKSFAKMSSQPNAAAYYGVSNALATSTATITMDWQEEKGAFGGFKLDYPGDYYYTCSNAFHYTVAGMTTTPVVPAQVVYMTGCSVSFLGGWIEGAAISAINAATAILKFVSVQTGSPVRSVAVLCTPPLTLPFHKYQRIGPELLGDDADQALPADTAEAAAG